MSESERSKINFMAPAKWQAVKDALRKFSTSAPFTLRIHEEHDEFIMERVHDDFVPKRLRLEYDALVPQIKWSCCDPQEHRGEIRFRIVGDSVIYIVNGKVTPLEEIAVVLSSCVAGSI